MAQKYGAQIAVGVDMKDGAVAVNGWKEVTPEPGVAFCRRCANAGVKAIIATGYFPGRHDAGHQYDAVP